MGTARCTAVVWMALVWALPAVVHAQPRVGALDGRSWAEVISDWVEDMGSNGTAVSLCVRQDADRCMPCGSYAISADPAIAVGACDPTSGATSVLLVDRAALFDHTHAVPVPREVAVRVTLAGGTTTEAVAPRAAGTSVGCSVSVRPYVRDLEHGTIVMLGPDAYDVVVARVRATVEPSADGGFVISSTDEAITSIEYDVVERATGAVVLVGHATLGCRSVADVPATGPGAVAPIPLAPRDERLARVSPSVAANSGIHVRPRPRGSDVADGLVIAGTAIAAASVVTLIAIGIGTGLHTMGTCLDGGPPPFRSGGPTSIGGAAASCRLRGPPHPSETPAELTWSMVGGIGAGLALALASLVVRDAMGERDDAVRVAVDLGPDGGSVGVGTRF